MLAEHKAVFDCFKAFWETDFTEDLKKFDVPTLILHGDDDQIVPIGAAALLSSKIVKGATLKTYSGVPHGVYSTLKDRVNAELLAFIGEAKPSRRDGKISHSFKIEPQFMNILIGTIVAFLIGSGYRYSNIPVPSPPILPGALHTR